MCRRVLCFETVFVCTSPHHDEHLYRINWQSSYPFNNIYLILNCNLDLQLTWVKHALCPSTNHDEHVYQVTWQSLHHFKNKMFVFELWPWPESNRHSHIALSYWTLVQNYLTILSAIRNIQDWQEIQFSSDRLFFFSHIKCKQ